MLHHSDGRRDRGVAAVEFAIVLPVLLMIVFGTIEWGRYFFIREAVVHAAREGARAAALLDGSSPKACAATIAYLSQIRMSPSCPGDITVDMDYPIDVNGVTIDGVQVAINMDFESLTGLGLGIPDVIGATSVMPAQ